MKRLLIVAAGVLALSACAPHTATAPEIHPGQVILCAPGDIDTRGHADGGVDVTCAHPGPVTSGSWHGFDLGTVLQCTGDWESDNYDKGDDPALPNGGTWVHCDGDTRQEAQAK